MSEQLPGHLSDQDIEDFIRRRMPPSELIIADDHLSTCDACYQRINVPTLLDGKLVTLSTTDLTAVTDKSDHLRYSQLAGYVDAELNDVDHEICDVHLRVCQACSEELRDLSAFKAAMAQSKTDQPVSSSSLSVSHIPFWRRPLKWSSPKLAVAAAICALLVGATAWAIWTLSRSPEREVAKSTVPPTTTESPTPSVKQAVQSPSPIPSEHVIVTLNDAGKTVTLDDKGNLNGAGELPQSYQQAVKLALTTGQLNIPPEVQLLTRNSGVLMGGKNEGVPFALVYPVGKVVRSGRQTFRWQRLEGASGYIVNIYDSSFNKLITSPQLGTTQWALPSSLSAGQTYLWQVTAIKDGEEIKSPAQPAPEARFRVLERARDAELKRAEVTYANSHLVLGTLYAQAGLLDDAEREFRALLAANPQSTITPKLLREVRARNSK